MPSKWHVLGIVGTGVFMCTLDSSIVNVSLPAIASHFGVPVGAQVEWVIIAYLVVIASTLLTRWLAAAGMTILCLGLLLLARLDEQTSLWGIVWPQLVAAVGMALFQSPNNSAIMGAAPRDRQGVAAGMLATGRTMGQSLSVAIAGAVFVGFGSAAAGRALLKHPHDAALSATFLHGYRWALLACAGISAAAIVTSLPRGREQVHSPSRSSPARGPLPSSRISPAT